MRFDLSSIWLCLFAILVAALLSGCSQEKTINGQVFIVTEGRDNVKLGLVAIYVVSGDEMRQLAVKTAGAFRQASANQEVLQKLERKMEALMSTGVKVPEVEAMVRETRQRRARIEFGMSGPQLADKLFGSLPPLQTKTDGDGQFTVRATSDSWLLARESRQTGSKTEKYVWIVSLKERRSKMLLSNDSMVTDSEGLLRVLNSFSADDGAVSPNMDEVRWAAQATEKAVPLVAAAKARVEAAKAKVEAARAKEDADKRERSLVAALSRASVSRRKLVGGEVLKLPTKIPDVVLCWIPSGSFRMGSPDYEPGRSSDEIQHEVLLSRGFFMGATECTQEQWEAVMGMNPSFFKGDRLPVENVNWQAAREFCRKLTKHLREEELLPEGWQFDLPTEAEWEYACRAGTTGAYAGEIDALGWHSKNSEGKTHPAKTKAPNAWGLYDTHGNVREWCLDWAAGYLSQAVTDPTGSSSGFQRVGRGGSWGVEAKDCRSASRGRYSPGQSNSTVGFRFILSSFR